MTDPAAFAVRDSHVRFISGIWLGVGLCFLVAAIRPAPMRPVILCLCALIFVGGLMRLTQADAATVMSPDILRSLLLELLVFPVLAAGVYVAGR